MRSLYFAPALCLGLGILRWRRQTHKQRIIVQLNQYATRVECAKCAGNPGETVCVCARVCMFILPRRIRLDFLDFTELVSSVLHCEEQGQMTGKSNSKYKKAQWWEVKGTDGDSKQLSVTVAQVIHRDSVVDAARMGGQGSPHRMPPSSIRSFYSTFAKHLVRARQHLRCLGDRDK